MAEDVGVAIDLRALNLFGRLASYPGNARFRKRLLKRETEAVMHRLSQLEAGHMARAAMPTEVPDWASVMLVSPPSRIGPFRLVERIGQGGMGDVWRGERDDGLFEQIVAIKFIATDLDPRAAAAFEAERRILARLDHPDIVRLIDGGITDGDLPYIIMEYVQGAPFDQAVAPLVLSQRIRLFIQTLKVVQFAHGKLVAHADLKPTNILVDTDGRVRLLDFGISGLVTGDRADGAPKGAMTIAFASPQRLAGAPPSIADDVYGLGRLLGLIAGGASDADLKAIVSKAMAAEEVERYPSIAPFISDIENWQARRPVTAQPDSLHYRARKFIARNLTLVTAAALAILALVSATAVATISSIRAEHARAEAAARYEDTHSIANYMMFDLYDMLDQTPGTLRVRENIVLKSNEYLRRLRTVPNPPPALRLDIAKAYLRLADVHGLSGNGNLGLGGAAIEDLGAAEGILTPLLRDYPFQSDVRVAMAQTLTKRSKTFLYADHHPDQALAMAQSAEHTLLVNRAISSNALGRRELWAARLAEGDALTWLGRSKEAISLLRFELQSADDRTQKTTLLMDDRRLIVRNLRFLGEAEFYAGDLQSGVEYLQRGAKEARALIQAGGSRPSDIISFINIAQILGETQSNLHRDLHAVATLTAAEDAALTLARLDRADVESRKRALSVGGDLALAMIAVHRLESAAKLISSVHEGYSELLGADPSDAALFRAYARSMAPAGTLARARGKPTLACLWFRRADDAWHTFDQRWGASISDKSDDIARIKAALASCH